MRTCYALCGHTVRLDRSAHATAHAHAQVSEMPCEGDTATNGTKHTGFKGLVVGTPSSVPYPLWRYQRLSHPHTTCKWIRWGNTPDGWCTPYVEQPPPPSDDAPLWGYRNAAPEMAPKAAGGGTRWFRNWAVTFSTPFVKEVLLPRFLLVSAAHTRASAMRNHVVPCYAMCVPCVYHVHVVHAHAHMCITHVRLLSAEGAACMCTVCVTWTSRRIFVHVL